MSRDLLGLTLRLAAPVALVVGVAVGGCHRGPGPGPKLPATGGGDSVQVAYGSQSRRTSTGGNSRVDGEVVRQGTVTTMADMLEGRVPGLEVRRLSGGGVSLRIRGERSLLASGEPLIVVDGIPVEGAGLLADMDPRDVKRIEVLKDAGSLAAYGSRGANGVLLITMNRRGR